MKRAIIAVTLLLITGAAGVAWKEIRHGRNAADAAAGAAIENARTRAAIRAMEQRLVAADRDRAEQSAALACAPEVESVAEPMASSAGAVDVAAVYRKGREREKDPKVQAIRLASWRAQLMASHGVLFRNLGLTISQIERFQDIAARRDEQNFDLNGILASEAELNGNVSAEIKAAVAKFRDQVKLEAETAWKELLGEDGYKALMEYNRTVDTRRVVSDLAGAAVVAGVPFTAEQAEQLTQVLANASHTYREGGSAYAANLDWSRADEQARGILSAPQMQFIQTVASPLSYQGRFSRRLSDLMAEIATVDAERSLGDAPKTGGG